MVPIWHPGAPSPLDILPHLIIIILLSVFIQNKIYLIHFFFYHVCQIDFRKIWFSPNIPASSGFRE